MSTTLALSDLVQVKTYTQTQGQLGLNVLHYSVAALSGPVDDTEILPLMSAIVSPLITAFMSYNANYVGLSMQKLVHGGPNPVAAYDKTNLGPGLRVSDLLPTATCGIITKQTATAGRKFRGRVYLPFCGEGDSDITGSPTGAVQVLFNDWATAMLQDQLYTIGLRTITLRPVVFHRKDFTFTTVTSWRVNAKWATQRRRSAYGRLNMLPAELL